MEPTALHDMLSMAIAHVEVIRKQLTDLKLSPDEPADSENSKRAQFLMAAASAIIDIMHPAFPEAYKMFPEKVHPLLDYYKVLYKKHPARTGEVQCPCRVCNGKIDDADTSRSTDKAEQV